ncbi:hypothetical protein F2Q68_00008603 [Brassica cretica]|uniref:Endonuclease/exonuclease/phosphatase domain-containing protein n=1 Tax=Brassica cretica TaxID=69181 RepID=A0A8S9KY25_BRACR|nr:hypothetical protein F2Q68_00008603 [Brassica cretica]
MFPELSGEDRKMAMLYISHADPTERMARIERQGYALSYTELLEAHHCNKTLQIAAPATYIGDTNEEVSESSGSMLSAYSSPINPSGFQLGPSTEGSVTGNVGVTIRTRADVKLKTEGYLILTFYREQKQKTFRTYGGFQSEAAASPMSIWSWKCQGAGSPERVQRLRNIRRKYFPDLLFLMETKQKFKFMDDLRLELGYDKMVTVESVGRRGGLALLWKNCYEVEILSTRSLRSDRAEWAFGRYVATELWLELGRYVATERSTRLVAA